MAELLSETPKLSLTCSAKDTSALVEFAYKACLPALLVSDCPWPVKEGNQDKTCSGPRKLRSLWLPLGSLSTKGVLGPRPMLTCTSAIKKRLTKDSAGFISPFDCTSLGVTRLNVLRLKSILPYPSHSGCRQSVWPSIVGTEEHGVRRCPPAGHNWLVRQKSLIVPVGSTWSWLFQERYVGGWLI